MAMVGLELVIVLVIILLFFGAKRVPQFGRCLGVGTRELKKTASEDTDESETKEASAKEAVEAKTKVVSEYAPRARGEDRVDRKATDQ